MEKATLNRRASATRISIYHDQVAEAAKGGDVENLPKGYYLRPDFLGTLIATCCASIVAFLGWVLPANTLSLINADLGVSQNITWVALVWTLATAVGYTLIGRLSDIFGRRWFIIGTSMLGLVGNIIAATAQSVSTLIVANIFNGLAASGQLSFPVIIGELVPNRARGPYNVVVLFSSMPFAVFGPVIARAFIQHTEGSWRWSYYLGIILSGISVILYFLFYWPPTYALLHVNGKAKLQQIDLVGVFLYSAGLVLFLIGVNWGGSSYPWRSAHVIGTIIAGVLTLTVLGFWEAHSGLNYPLIPMRLFRNIQWVAITVCATVGAMIYYSMSVLWPLVVGSLYTNDVTEIGWMSCVVGGGLLLGQVLGGFGIRYLPRMKIQMFIAALFVCAFVGGLGSVNQGNQSQTVALFIIGCVGVGYVEILTLSSVALVWEPEDIGLSTGILGSIRSAGGSVATAIYTSILTNKLATNVPKYVAPAATSAGLPVSSLPALFSGISTGSFASVPGINNEILAAITGPIKTAYAKSFSTVFLATISFSGLLVLAALLSPNVEDYLTGEVARKLVHGGRVSETSSDSRKDVEPQTP
ncbi:hypothetical protein FGG08_002979 [Glutinoglossum americanum]|uniref:Major facilitator superfamily (MFS) profile domain-containing protein n=1 Tax=Glutinoglossum americanum TaxID=1670608 RepID=A0A9P8IE72_9PEZI|nr:hypothetical protein FGG08_002979 [Glutinoglossum americanum]